MIFEQIVTIWWLLFYNKVLLVVATLACITVEFMFKYNAQNTVYIE